MCTKIKQHKLVLQYVNYIHNSQQIHGPAFNMLVKVFPVYNVFPPKQTAYTDNVCALFTPPAIVMKSKKATLSKIKLYPHHLSSYMAICANCSELHLLSLSSLCGISVIPLYCLEVGHVRYLKI